MNGKIKEALNYMDPKYINEAVEYKAKSRNYKPLVRWGALAACLVLVVSLSFGLLGGKPAVDPTGTTAAQEKEIVLPPCRNSESNYAASVLNCTFEEAFEEAEVVAWVRIGNWLGEDCDPIDRTFFEAEVIQCYKGEIGDEFVLLQLGSSQGTFLGCPLYTYGNEFLLFLKESGSNMNTHEYSTTYYNMRMSTTMMDIVKDEAGTVYVSARGLFFGESISSLSEEMNNLAGNSNIKNELEARTMAIDEIQSEAVANAAYIFELEALKEYMRLS